MKFFLGKLEKLIFYLLVFCLPLQLRHIFYVWGKDFNEWQGIYLYATDFLVLALLALWLWRIACHSGLDPESRVFGSRIKCGMTEKALLVFLFFSFVSLILAKNFWLGFYSFGKLAEFSFLFLYLKRNFGRFFSRQNFWLVFSASAVLQSLIAIIQFLKQGSLGLKFLAESPLAPDISGVAKIVLDGEKLIRAYGTLPHPNILAAILTAAIFGLGCLFLKNYQSCHSGPDPESRASGSRIKCGMTKLIVFIFIFFLLIFTIFLTFSRAILILGFLFFIFWVAVIWRTIELKKPIKILFLIFVMCYMLYVICFWPFLAARFSDLKPGEQAIDLRIFYAQAAESFLKESPILGVGQGNFVYTLNQKFPDLPIWQFQPVHNIYLLIAAETGILGLLAFLLFLFLTVKSAWQKRDELLVSCFLFAVFYLLLTGLTDHFLWDLQQGQLLFWMFLGILASWGAHSPSPMKL